MTSSAPPAAGVRTPWEALPEPVRDAIAEVLGARVTHAVTQSGGFSPGAAARVRTATGTRAFVKAVSADTKPDSPRLHRAEARNAAALPPTVPAPRQYDDGTWVALVFEDVPARQPHVPWREPELRRVLDAVAVLGDALTPSPVEAPPVADALAGTFDGWRELLDGCDGCDGCDGGDGRDEGDDGNRRIEGDEGDGRDEVTTEARIAARLGPWAAAHLPRLAELAAPWPEAASGDTLAHADLRADNMLLTGDGRVVFVDWPHALRAASWFDLLVMLPCVRAQGGPDPEEVFTGHPLARNADPDAVTATLAALTGFFLSHALRPPPPGIPTLRAFQRAQGDAALAWLRKRLGPGPA